MRPIGRDFQTADVNVTIASAVKHDVDETIMVDSGDGEVAIVATGQQERL